MSTALTYFTELEDGSHKCNECDKLNINKVYQSKTGKSNLVYHLRTKHNIIIATAATTESIAHVPLTEKEKSEVTKAFVKWVVNGLQPFTICENEYFSQFVRRLNPLYQIPSRRSLKMEVFRLFDLAKESIKSILHETAGAISLTVDLWTSLTMDSYCGVTAHFMSDEWQLKHLVLDVRPMPYPHTGEAIKDILMEIILDFGIQTKLLSLTTDNASSMVAAFSLLAEEMTSKFQRKIYHIRCGAHVLNLAVQAGLKNLSEQQSPTVKTSGAKKGRNIQDVRENNKEGIVF